MRVLLLTALFIILFLFTNFAQSNLWTDISENQIEIVSERYIIPNTYRTLKLNTNEAKILMEGSPLEFIETNYRDRSIIELPMPDGTFQAFYFWESSAMEPELQEKFPEIRTYTGQGIDDPFATLKFDLTPLGFHAQILSPDGRVFIDPYSLHDIENYISYYTRDFTKYNDDFSCEVKYHDEYIQPESLDNNFPYEAIGPQLRTYRLANAATGEYTAFFGGTVTAGLAAVTTSVNRVNGVYEREVGIRMVLVANNNLIIYTNASTDPYTNNNGSTMLTQNITNLNSIIGSSNYDIGHVFSTGGGGVAYLGCVCTSSKAGGVTGSSSPVGDPYDIDYVAHEMGHQFGANHTFNSVTSSCGGGNRNATTAYEPGSGSTIMAYAGICGADNLQPHSDPHFHVGSFDEIVAYTNTGGGNGCAVKTNTGNNVPVVTVPAGGFYIPKSTTFSLTGSATDPNGDVLTYSWEEIDLGPSGSPASPTGDAPIFRSWVPTSSPTRTFPRLVNLLNNTTVIGEILPSYSRNLKFRFTVRDNRAGGGGVDWKQVNFAVDGNSGPFVITSPNTNVSWLGNSNQTVTWNVANTTSSPVNCSNVRILLSTDGGNTFPTELIASTPNDGSETVFIPNLPTTQARIKVEAAGNIFFDISNVNFTIVNNNSFQLSVLIDDGWNIVSIPGLHPTNQNVDTWWSYRDFSANVFKFTSSYGPVSTVEPGTGYWLKQNGFRVYNTGDEWPAAGITIVPHNPIPVVSGWNIIGGYENEAATSGISTTPLNIISGSFFGYTPIIGYYIANTLTPGYGYWVNTSGTGVINIPSSLVKDKDNKSNVINDSWGKLFFIDNSGKNYTLYLTTETSDLRKYELPPVPFSDMFDIRFSSGRFVDNIDDRFLSVVIQGVDYPVKVSVENTTLDISDKTGKSLFNKIKSGDVLEITNKETNEIVICYSDVVLDYNLEQNFPNPFNPSTKIKWQSPVDAWQTLKVFDVLGNEIAILVNEFRQAGRYNIEFPTAVSNSSKLSSGVYYYQLTIGDYVQTRKMILIK